MLRRCVMSVIAVSGAAVALSVDAQPADTPRELQPSAGSEASDASPARESLDFERAYRVWRAVLPNVLEPLPAPSAQPAQHAAEIVQLGDFEVVVRAQRDFARSRDAELRALHESVDDEERQALQAYVDAGNVELPQLRRTTLTQAVCSGKASTASDLAAAHLGADALHAQRVIELVQGLRTVLDVDSYDRVHARAASRGNGMSNTDFITLVPTNSAARYAAMSQEQVIAELKRICGGVWSYHSDGQAA